MSDSITIARPYAKAIFKHALMSKKLHEWSTYLQGLALLAMDSNAVDFLNNPASTAMQHSELLNVMTSNVPKDDLMFLSNFVEILAHNKRLLLLPDIVTLYEFMRAEHEKTLAVNVTSYSSLSSAQQKSLVASLSQRLQREVTLNITIDKALLGGAVISAGDLVIDGSVRGKLYKLDTSLAA